MSEQGVLEGTEHALLRDPVLRISETDVLLPTLTTWGRSVRKSRIQLQREVFSPRVLSLVMGFESTVVLNAALSSINSILTKCPFCPCWKGQCGVQ